MAAAPGEQQEGEGEHLQLSLADLPEAVLAQVLGQLDAPLLARLCVQDKRLRKLAGEQQLWQRLALARWPAATAAHHGGNWQRLYRHRVVLAPGLLTCVDRCHGLTAKAAAGEQLRLNASSLPHLASPEGSPVKSNVYGCYSRPYASIPEMVLEQIMQMLFSLCLWNARLMGGGASSSSLAVCDRGGSGAVQAALAAELLLVRGDMAWWLGKRPDAVLFFVRRTADLLGGSDGCSGVSSWQDVLWRRSALQFLTDDLRLGPEVGVCPSVTSRLAREVGRLDGAIRGTDAQASGLCCRPPAGLPPQHWWYGLAGAGQLSSAAC